MIFDTYQGAVVCPAELRTQCVRIWECAVKLTTNF